jgi:phenylpropionate dioxygenase-like ring-hydroxylating dioxygenase large terminal subunit
MNDRMIPPTMAQCDAINYQEILDTDTRPVPECLRERNVPDLGTRPVPVEHYTSAEVFQKSIGKMWLRTWQMVCREEEIPNVGDSYVYDIVGKSLIIVRTAPNEVKALHNSCLHRGRKLMTQNGSRKEFWCPFHGFSWNIDGSLKNNPIAWDFRHCPSQDLSLPEAQVGRWGGFVFVNFDPAAPPLENVLDPIPRHMARWTFEDKYIYAHVAKRTKANWMVASEAFMETHHALGTHPQIMPFITDANAQYDIFSEHVTRHISGRGYQSPFITDRVLTQNEIAAALINQGSGARGMTRDAKTEVPEGMTARSYVADVARRQLQEQTGHDHSKVADCELGDSLIYNVFPNLSVWGGFIPNLVYRWRPVGVKHDETLMEIYVLRLCPKDEPRPKPAQLRILSEDEPWAAATELGGLGAVVDQDWSNMEAVQEGLAASQTGVVQLGHYLEMRIRHHHAVFDGYLSRP